ncbi:ankyrin repeat domain-containing protein 9 [Pseudophryne corroboree]|uniref:ankyrin repeat domain-containing protein 9 n=1 Tax=Pseudophryne corroboree TaxID=495146 RepID=UPI0030816B89
MPGTAHYQSQRQCKQTSFAFYQAVRDLLPVWLLEDMRLMEVLHWEDGGRVSCYSPSEALLYALVHDHQPYARYLLHHFPQDALAVPSPSFSCCQAAAPHLPLAVRYDRLQILREILHTLQALPAASRAACINRRGCQRLEGGKTPVHLACELQRAECLTLLLGHGSCPYATDCSGNTPLDCLLQLIRTGAPQDPRPLRLCMDSLLLYMPRGLPPSTRHQLQQESIAWQELLGQELFRWLTGTSPPSLGTLAMQSLLRALPADRFPEVLEEIHLPQCLRPPALQQQLVRR